METVIPASKSPLRLLRAGILAAVALALGCPASPSPASSAKLATDFVLKVGASAQIEGESLEVGFVGVEADSRCPRDVQCVWAGDATVTLSLRKADAPPRTIERHTSPREDEPPDESGYRITLLALNPQPVSTGGPDPAEYTVTLRVESR